MFCGEERKSLGGMLLLTTFSKVMNDGSLKMFKKIDKSKWFNVAQIFLPATSWRGKGNFLGDFLDENNEPH